jgi:hypothetical protein
VLTNEPDYSDYQDPEYNWSLSVYGDVKEIIPTDIPEPKRKYVKSQSDIVVMDNLESVIRQNLKGHGVSDRLPDTDEMSVFLT